MNMTDTALLNRAAAFVWAEADMLDHREYADWLNLWTDDGLYVVPVDPDETDHAHTLNHAHDDDAMRRMRVQRLTGGESVSTQPAPRTQRVVSRLRLLSDVDGLVTLRAAQLISEYRKGVVRQHSANVEYRLLKMAGWFKLQHKRVCLINSDDALVTVGYIF